MAVAENLLQQSGPVQPPPVIRANGLHVPLAALLLLFGIFLVWFGTDGLSSAAMAWRIIAVAAGLIVAYIGLDRLLRRLVSPAIDTGLWLSVFPTVETLVAQALAALIVIGSYFIARRDTARSTLITPDEAPAV